MLQLPETRAQSVCTSVAPTQKAHRDRAMQRSTIDPIIERIREFHARLALWVKALNEVESIRARHRKHSENFEYPAIYLNELDSVMLNTDHPLERRFVTQLSIDLWGKERISFFERKSNKKRFRFGEGNRKTYMRKIEQIQFLIPRLKSDLRRVIRERRQFWAETGYASATADESNALARFFEARKKLLRTSPRSESGAVDLIAFVSDQLGKQGAPGILQPDVCASLLARANVVLTKAQGASSVRMQSKAKATSISQRRCSDVSLPR